MLNIGEAIPWYLCMFLSFSCEWRSSVVQARMCKLGRDPLIFLKILVVIGHVCIYWSKVAEGFSVFNAVLFYKIWSHINEEVIELIDNFYRVIYLFSVPYDWFQSMSFLFSFAQYLIYCVPRFPDVWSIVVKFIFVVRHFCFSYCFL